MCVCDFHQWIHREFMLIGDKKGIDRNGQLNGDYYGRS